MKRFLPWIIVGGVILLLVFYYINVKNSALKFNQGVGEAWGNVETAYQRRNDLIGNLVNTVKGAADFEKKHINCRN